MKAVVTVAICGAGNAWKVGGSSDPPTRLRERQVKLEIQGDDRNGYHLMMSPDGCFTADSWHESIAGAQETAEEMFGVPPDGWA